MTLSIHLWDLFEAEKVSVTSARALLKRGWRVVVLPFEYGSAGGVGKYAFALVSGDNKEVRQITNVTKEAILPDSVPSEKLEITGSVIALTVPFAEKDEVKLLGAKWVSTSKRWCIKEQDEATFLKWIPQDAPKECLNVLQHFE